MLTLIDLISQDKEYNDFQVYNLEGEEDWAWIGKAETVVNDYPLAEVVGVNDDTGELDVRI
jgi:hypothetical protein